MKALKLIDEEKLSYILANNDNTSEFDSWTYDDDDMMKISSRSLYTNLFRYLRNNTLLWDKFL